MAATANTAAKAGGNKKASRTLIDPIYQKYTKSVIRSLASTEFYEFFMDAIAKADNEFQFSNRKLQKTVDVTWIDAIEEALDGMQNIIASPRNVIREEELIVNVAHAKKAGSDVVRHLAQHGSLVETFDEDSGEIRPGRLMQKLREDSTDLYENRLVFTVLESAFHFVKIRHDALLEAMSDEFGAKLKMRSDMQSATEMVHLDMFLHIKETDSALQTDEKNQEVFARISRLYRLLSMFMNTPFAQQMSKLNRVKGTLVKTNVLKRNADYKAIVKLWDFLHQYEDVGYTIRVVEQNPVIDENFQRDIYHNILFSYIILKGYLEDEKDRMIPVFGKEKRRVLKPRFIRQIIEEITEDYDLPDVEVRKVLIEELTKAQLMKEEAEERRRLVEEQAQRKKAEAERLRQEKEAEQERLRQEREAERERIRLEKEAEKARLRQEKMEREAEDRRRGGLFRQETEWFQEHLAERLEAREKLREREETRRQRDAKAARLLEEAEERSREEALRLKQRRDEEQARLQREKQQAAEQARREREELQQAQLAEQKRLQEEQQAKDQEQAAVYQAEWKWFQDTRPGRLQMRAEQQAREKAALEQLAQERRIRQAQRRAENQRINK